LVIQLVIELPKYHIHDLAGGIIAIGLLREIGPLTVGLAWAGRIAARISEDAHTFIAHSSEIDFAQRFILPRYIAATLMAIPLSAYGLVIGFVTAAFVAPLLSVSSTNIFLDSAQQAVNSRDIFTYFLKLVFANPFVAVMAGSACGILKGRPARLVSIDAVTATVMSVFVANLMVTMIMYYQ
jgi:phospholipid/cholesterol/gamma-HCH transport system permease protein